MFYQDPPKVFTISSTSKVKLGLMVLLKASIGGLLPDTLSVAGPTVTQLEVFYSSDYL